MNECAELGVLAAGHLTFTNSTQTLLRNTRNILLPQRKTLNFSVKSSICPH